MGIVSPSAGDGWIGGVYVVQQIVKCVMLAGRDHVRFRDVWSSAPPGKDPFGEIRALLDPPVHLAMPQTVIQRAATAVRRRINGRTATAQQLRDAGVGVLFPVSPFDDSSIPFVFLLPDFQYRHVTEVNDQRSFDYFDAMYRTQASRATLVLMESRSVEADLARFMPEFVPKARFAFPRAFASAEWTSVEPSDAARRYGLPARYFHISNQVSAHKNHITVLRAAHKLKQDGIRVDVICTGKSADYRDPAFFEQLKTEAIALGVDDRVRFLGIVPRADQLAIMRGSLAVLQPSLFEGWGAAVAEAKALGKPLLISDIPVHREHGADAFAWLPLRDADAWADALRRALEELSPGPDRDAETRADAVARAEARESGEAFIRIFDEAIAASR